MGIGTDAYGDGRFLLLRKQTGNAQETATQALEAVNRLENELEELAEQTTSFTKKLTFSAAGSTSISDARLTADHRVTAAQFFDSSNNAVDSALADLTWDTSDGVCAITISTVYGAGSVELSFTYAP